MGAFSKLFSRLRITSDPNVGTQTSAVIQADSGDTNLVIAPSGVGAIVAQIPDGTTTGGNARGNNAIDFSRGRIASNAVASATNSAILGGFSNRASGASSNVTGGDYNAATGNYSHIGGGINNIASDEYAVVAGGNGNTASGRRSFVGGGTGNTAAAIFNNSVIGGSGNTSSGGEAIAGGWSSVASGSRSVALGFSGTASGGGSFAMAGTASGIGATAFSGGNASNDYVFAHGDYAVSSLYGSLTKANGRFTSSVIGNNGLAQTHSVIARREAALTSGATTVLSLDGTGTTNFIGITSNNLNFGGAYSYRINYVAIVIGISGTATGLSIGDIKTQNIEIAAKSVNNVPAVLVGAGSYSIAQEDASMNSALLTPSIGAGPSLQLTFTSPTFAGGGTVTYRVVAQVQIVEVRYGT